MSRKWLFLWISCGITAHTEKLDITACQHPVVDMMVSTTLPWFVAFINASIGKRPIASISAQELVMLRKMEGKGRYETAKRLRSTCSQIFRYAIATARAERDVAADLRGALVAPKPVHRAAITSAPGAGALVRAIEAFEGHPTPEQLCGCCRMSLCVLVNCALPNGRISTRRRRSGL